ncbi:MAG: hypothetical protein DME23_13525 [Verrucomicrobia bacterium]|nr:MAG: hypothetical protein DME23_13525 [Verrucomicrobiota bacterium]
MIHRLMNPTERKISSLSVLLVALTFLTVGCRSSRPKPVAWNVSITKVTPASIEVDVVGVTPSEKPYWMNSVKPDDYWKQTSSIRNGARKVSNNLQTGQPWVLGKENPIWKEWFGYGATELMIMANLPGKGYDNGPFDRRRVFISLDKKVWEAKDNTIQIQVQDEFIRVLTPQKPAG